MFDAPTVVDGRGHLLGRLASIVAKELLCGQKVVVVRCEQITISGSRKCKSQSALTCLTVTDIAIFYEVVGLSLYCRAYRVPHSSLSRLSVYSRAMQGMEPHHLEVLGTLIVMLFLSKAVYRRRQQTSK